MTMVQRSSTYVASSKHGLPAWMNGFYEENGAAVDDAESVLSSLVVLCVGLTDVGGGGFSMMFSSLPMALIERFHKTTTKEVFEKDKPILDGLEKVGFKLNRFESGLFMKLFKEGGGYYRELNWLTRREIRLLMFDFSGCWLLKAHRRREDQGQTRTRNRRNFAQRCPLVSYGTLAGSNTCL